MADEPASKAAAQGPFNTIQADDPRAMHDLTIVLRCASEAAAYGLMMDFASKMYVSCEGLDQHDENRSIPVAGTRIDLVSRGITPQKLGYSVVTVHDESKFSQ